jgi:adenylate cyclase
MLVLDMHVMDTHSGSEAWRGRIAHPVALARWTDNPFGRDALQGLSDALMGQACAERDLGGLPEIDGYRLLFSAMTLMHRRSRQDFERSLRLLQALIERHPEASEPQAWLAKWHVMRVARRLSASVADDRQAALAAAARALERGGDRALALAIDGHVRAYLSRDFDAAEAQLQAALVENPSESLAWLYLSAVQVYQDRGREAADAARMAQLLSPLDPLRYYYDSFAAHALLAAGQLPQATVLAQRSVSAFPSHVPTLVTLALARALQQQDGLGRQVIERLRRVDPGYCVEGFHTVYPGAAAPYGQRWAAALRQLGLPERV